MCAPSGYSILKHRARALWLNHNPARRYLALATSYFGFFDASGKPQESVLYVSGFISTEEKWLRFEGTWKALLRQYGIEGWFHTSDYVRAAGEDYKQFRDNDALRSEFETKAVTTIKHHILKPFSYGVLLSDHREMVTRYEVPIGFERPYSFCAMQGVYFIWQWLEKKKRKKKGKKTLTLQDRVHLIYEDGDEDRGRFSDAMYHDFKLRPSFAAKQRAHPFSAADILAWRHARLIKVVKGEAPKPKREFFAGLFKQIPHASCGFYDRTTLESFCVEKNFKRRSTASDAS